MVPFSLACCIVLYDVFVSVLQLDCVHPGQFDPCAKRIIEGIIECISDSGVHTDLDEVASPTSAMEAFSLMVETNADYVDAFCR